MDHLDELESKSIFIIREAYKQFKKVAMLWSIGKDSSCLLWLVRKAFYGKIPFPIVHIDTSFKFPEMIKWRDEYAKKWNPSIHFEYHRQFLHNEKGIQQCKEKFGSLGKKAAKIHLIRDVELYVLRKPFREVMGNEIDELYEKSLQYFIPVKEI